MLLNSQKIGVFDEKIWKHLAQRITGNIMDAKVTDLTMAVKSIALLNRDQRELLV